MLDLYFILFANRKQASSMHTVGNLWISEASLSKLEKIQCSSALPNIKQFCSIIFGSIELVIYLCFIIIYFPIDTIVLSLW